MAKPPFAALICGFAAVGTVLGFFAVQFRAEGNEEYVSYASQGSYAMLFTAFMVGVTWYRIRKAESD
ncbi:hypothetical protein [Streptomyces sp. MST-110588]|uniref:hypothetical protein n=1 Tax=Streptomyces sp. MST-110588 TaxID=2833628 RepID=UPI001F5D1831|nr:hypothetical protein [Streptomyces sp. MST-110588]UNO41035.1 hypothetical protein KGS77_17380 [Streptomyces sp. MST-110588]